MESGFLAEEKMAKPKSDYIEGGKYENRPKIVTFENGMGSVKVQIYQFCNGHFIEQTL